MRLQVPTRVSRSRTSTASGTDGPLTQVLPPPALPAQSRQGYWRGRYKPRYNAEAVPVDLRDDCGRGVDVGPFPAASPVRTKAAETEVLVHPTCTAQKILPVTHGQTCDRQHEKTGLNIPLTSRNILVEMVARGGIEPPTFRFSVGRRASKGSTPDHAMASLWDAKCQGPLTIVVNYRELWTGVGYW